MLYECHVGNTVLSNEGGCRILVNGESFIVDMEDFAIIAVLRYLLNVQNIEQLLSWACIELNIHSKKKLLELLPNADVFSKHIGEDIDSSFYKTAFNWVHDKLN